MKRHRYIVRKANASSYDHHVVSVGKEAELIIAVARGRRWARRIARLLNAEENPSTRITG